METTLDRFGRIIIPKDVRDDMGLEAGAVLQIEKKEKRSSFSPYRVNRRSLRKRGSWSSPAPRWAMSELLCTNIESAV